VSSWRIKSAVAVCISATIATNATAALGVQSLSNRKPMEQIAPNDLMPPDTLLALGTLSGYIAMTSALSPRNKVTGGRQSALGAYATHRRLDGVVRNNNRGPDEYFAPRYRDGKCVEDEGNTLLAEPAFGGGVWRMEGKSLEQRLASLCRNAAL
jgi:hypothetical protein